ncbi:MAG: glycosyltransferase, partial [Acidobacteriota bacterium]
GTVSDHEFFQCLLPEGFTLRVHGFGDSVGEQQQAFAGSEPARRAGLPVVLRAQNVESALWTFASRYRSALLKAFFRREAAKLAAWESKCVRQADATIALTRFDADAIRKLAGAEATVETVEAPFVGQMKSGGPALEGDPAVVILASRKWLPNRDAVWRFVGETWPRVHQVLPSARLHVFGISKSVDRSPGVMWHPAPEKSADAFPSGAVVAIPSRHPTGVPMKCLEAWARRLPVVGSPEAAEQLEAEDGREMLVASGSEHFARAMVMLHENPGLRDRLVAGGREVLKLRHDPVKVVAKLEKVYEQAMEGQRVKEPKSQRG